MPHTAAEEVRIELISHERDGSAFHADPDAATPRQRRSAEYPAGEMLPKLARRSVSPMRVAIGAAPMDEGDVSLNGPARASTPSLTEGFTAGVRNSDGNTNTSSAGIAGGSDGAPPKRASLTEPRLLEHRGSGESGQERGHTQKGAFMQVMCAPAALPETPCFSPRRRTLIHQPRSKQVGQLNGPMLAAMKGKDPGIEEMIRAISPCASPPSGRAKAPWLKTLCLKHPGCLLYTSPSQRDRQKSRMPSSA